MRIPKDVRWDLSVAEAVRLQKELSRKVDDSDRLPERIEVVAGADVHPIGSQHMIAVVALLTYPGLDLVETSQALVAVTFPYVPGLLAFREMPAVLKALEGLEREPDVILCDAHGRAHPRRFGLACHAGVLLDKPSIGCAKSRLYGEGEEPDDEPGSWTELRSPEDGSVIGAIVRTVKGGAPLFVSVGHRISLPTAIQIVLDCVQGRRLPEPLRIAHQIASEIGQRRRSMGQGKLI